MGMGIYAAASGMVLEEKRQESIARNLAAANIAGYKREYLVSHRFEDKMEESLDQPPEGNFLGSGPAQVKIDHSMGELQQTDRPLDFVVQGEGFFEVVTPEGGKLYTRNGNFYLDKNRTLVTQEGYFVSGKAGARIQFNVDDDINHLQCTTDGYIRIPDLANGTYNDAGQFKIVAIKDEDALIRMTAKYYTVAPKDRRLIYEPDPLNTKEYQNPFNYQITNRYQEMPNSNPLLDMAALVQSNRDYEMNYKIVKMLAQRAEKEIRELS